MFEGLDEKLQSIVDRFPTLFRHMVEAHVPSEEVLKDERSREAAIKSFGSANREEIRETIRREYVRKWSPILFGAEEVAAQLHSYGPVPDDNLLRFATELVFDTGRICGLLEGTDVSHVRNVLCPRALEVAFDIQDRNLSEKTLASLCAILSYAPIVIGVVVDDYKVANGLKAEGALSLLSDPKHARVMEDMAKVGGDLTRGGLAVFFAVQQKLKSRNNSSLN